MAPTPRSRPLRVGIDLDGVLANFDHAFRRLLSEITRKPLKLLNATPQSRVPFSPDLGAVERPDIDAKTLQRAYDEVDSNPQFWASLAPLSGAVSTLKTLATLHRDGRMEPYLLAMRRSPNAYWQTRVWVDHAVKPLDVTLPVIMVRGTSGRYRVAKGLAAAALGLDWVVDDQFLALRSVADHSPGTRLVLVRDSPLDTRGARGGDLQIERISNVEDLVAILTSPTQGLGKAG